MSVLKLQNITKVFGIGNAAHIALDDVSLEIEQGEFVAIMGPSGSGKTTLLNIIGLLDDPTEGNYTLMDENAHDLGEKRLAELRRDNIGFVFQSFNLIPNMSVLENVALPLAYSGKTHIQRLQLASDMLERLHIRSKEYYYPRQLSGGQTQRAAIARALVNNPNIVVADEPTGNLDSLSSETIMELLKTINKEGNTVLMVTHNPELTKYASRIIYMKDGQVKIDQDLSSSQQVDLTKVQQVVKDTEKQDHERRKKRNKAERRARAKAKRKNKKDKK
ncbi:MAG: ABC transporter ATP-binding protein [Patescibacteria group bacterium]